MTAAPIMKITPKPSIPLARSPHTFLSGALYKITVPPFSPARAQAQMFTFLPSHATDDTALIHYTHGQFDSWFRLSLTVEPVRNVRLLEIYKVTARSYGRVVFQAFGGYNPGSNIHCQLSDVHALVLEYQKKSSTSVLGKSNTSVHVFFIPQPVTYEPSDEPGMKYFTFRDNVSSEEVQEEVTDPRHLFKEGEQWFVVRVVAAVITATKFNLIATKLADSKDLAVYSHVFINATNS